MTMETPAIKVARRVSEAINYRSSRFIMYKALQKCRVENASKIHTFTTPNELKKLYELAVACPPNALALEIGSYMGASSCYIAAGLATNGGRLICVDTWQNETMPEGIRDTFAEFMSNTQGVHSYIKPLRKSSEELNQTDVDLPLSLVFIDGDHNYNAVKNDFERVAPWIALNGNVAFHDCMYFQGVSQVIGEALASGKWVIGGHIENLMWLKRAVW